MKEVNIKIQEEFEEKVVKGIEYDENDLYLVKEVYMNWKSLNNKLNDISARAITIPNEIVEELYCIITGCIQVNDRNHTFDCYDVKKSKKIEIKSSTKFTNILIKDIIDFDILVFMLFNPIDDRVRIYSIEKKIISEFVNYGRRINIENIINRCSIEPTIVNLLEVL